MEFFHRAPGRPSRLGVLPGSFNPPTIAHLALASAASPWVDEVVFVVPRTFPHKPYTGATFAERVEMLRHACHGQPSFSIAASDQGLFVDIARECRAAYGEAVELTFLCGRDAAERIASWDYGRPEAFAEMLERFHLLVAARHGEYVAPRQLAHAIRHLPVTGDLDPVSSSEVRRRIADGDRWEHLVPNPIRETVQAIYS